METEVEIVSMLLSEREALRLERKLIKENRKELTNISSGTIDVYDVLVAHAKYGIEKHSRDILLEESGKVVFEKGWIDACRSWLKYCIEIVEKYDKGIDGKKEAQSGTYTKARKICCRIFDDSMQRRRLFALVTAKRPRGRLPLKTCQNGHCRSHCKSRQKIIERAEWTAQDRIDALKALFERASKEDVKTAISAIPAIMEVIKCRAAMPQPSRSFRVQTADQSKLSTNHGASGCARKSKKAAFSPLGCGLF